MPRSIRSPKLGPSTVLTFAVALVLAATGQVLATGTSGPAYRADAAPGTVAAGTHPTMTITLTQLSGSHDRKMGSVRITPPSGFGLVSATAKRGSHVLAVTIASGAATVNNVGLDTAGKTATVTLETTVACGVSGSREWTVVARKTSTFDSGGTALSRDGASQLTTQVDRCYLAFATQPKSAAVDTVITAEEAKPSGTKVKVQLRDGNGNDESQGGIGVSLAIVSGTGASGANLSGGSDTTNGDGVAILSPRIDTVGQDYELVASSTVSGIGSSADSASFDINDVAVVCSGSCSGSSQQGNTGATVNAESNGGVLSFSIGVDNVDCNNSANKFYQGTSEALTFNVTGGTGRTEVTLKLDKASVNKPVLKYDVCFSSPHSSFTNKFFKKIAAGDGGLLPFCINPLRPRGEPCVILKWKDRAGNVLVKFSVPAGDPRGKI